MAQLNRTDLAMTDLIEKSVASSGRILNLETSLQSQSDLFKPLHEQTEVNLLLMQGRLDELHKGSQHFDKQLKGHHADMLVFDAAIGTLCSDVEAKYVSLHKGIVDALEGSGFEQHVSTTIAEDVR